MLRQPTILKGEPTEQLIQLVSSAEAELGLIPTDRAARRSVPLLVGKTWMYFTTPFESATSFLPQRIASAFAFRGLNALKTRNTCSARWIHFKSNITAYFPEHGLLAKIRRPTSHNDCAALMREHDTLTDHAAQQLINSKQTAH